MNLIKYQYAYNYILCEDNYPQLQNCILLYITHSRLTLVIYPKLILHMFSQFIMRFHALCHYPFRMMFNDIHDVEYIRFIFSISYPYCSLYILPIYPWWSIDWWSIIRFVSNSVIMSMLSMNYSSIYCPYLPSGILTLSNGKSPFCKRYVNKLHKQWRAIFFGNFFCFFLGFFFVFSFACGFGFWLDNWPLVAFGFCGFLAFGFLWLLAFWLFGFWLLALGFTSTIGFWWLVAFWLLASCRHLAFWLLVALAFCGFWLVAFVAFLAFGFWLHVDIWLFVAFGFLAFGFLSTFGFLASCGFGFCGFLAFGFLCL